MKLIKFGLVAVAAFTMACNSKATLVPIGVTTNYSKLTISVTITTNAPSVETKPDVTVYKVGKAKLANKDLLALFASWDSTTWPAGAQLVVAWDAPWATNVVVVDKTGTNVLFDATTWTGDSDQFFNINFFEGEGAYTETDNENEPGFYDFVWDNNGSFELFDDINGIDIFGNGPCMETFSQKWDKNGNYSTWSDSEKCSADGAGLEILAGSDYGTVSATINATGKGAGENYIYELY